MKRMLPKKKTPTARVALARGELMTVSQLATRANEPPHAVRYYCRIGLLKPSATSAGGYRLFDESVLNRLRFIRLAQRLGFTLEEIGGFIQSAAAGAEPCPDVKALLDSRLPQIGLELSEIEALYTRMTRAQTRWRDIRDGVPTGHEICRLIESEDLS